MPTANKIPIDLYHCYWKRNIKGSAVRWLVLIVIMGGIIAIAAAPEITALLQPIISVDGRSYLICETYSAQSSHSWIPSAIMFVKHNKKLYL